MSTDGTKLTASALATHAITFNAPVIGDWVMRINGSGAIELNAKIPQSEAATRFVEIASQMLRNNVANELGRLMDENKRLTLALAVERARNDKMEGKR